MKNLILRTFTGLIFIVIIVGSILYNAYSFLLIFSAVTGLTIWELYGLVFKDKNVLKKILNVSGGVYLFVATFLFRYGITDTDIYIPYILFMLILFVSELYLKASDPISNWSKLLFIQVYCGGSFSLLNLLAIDSAFSYSPLWVLMIFVFVWLNDTAAYLTGITFGKNRLFERISPKKSWEGFWGGLITVVTAAIVISHFIHDTEWYNWLGLSVVVVVFSTWGDLIESLLKRTLVVKDSGTIIPGHGGMLDRFDSIMLAAPAAYVYFDLFIRN